MSLCCNQAATGARGLQPACSGPPVARLMKRPTYSRHYCGRIQTHMNPVLHRRHDGERCAVAAGGAAAAAGGVGAPRVRRPPWSAAGRRHHGPPPGSAVLRRPVRAAGAGNHSACPKPDRSTSRSSYGVASQVAMQLRTTMPPASTPCLDTCGAEHCQSEACCLRPHHRRATPATGASSCWRCSCWG